MKLPKPELPKYTATLPFAKTKITYRPYTVAEDKILSTAIISDSPEQITLAATQLVENCCNVDVTDLHPTDLEFLFIKLRAAAMGSEVKLRMNINCGEECPKEVRGKVSLENDLVMLGEEELIEAGFIRKKNGWLIQLTDEIGAVFNIRTSKSEDQAKILHDSLVCIYEGDTLVESSEIVPEELLEFIDALPSIIGDKIKVLFAAQPYLALRVKVICPKCQKEHTTEITGLLDFFVS